MAILRKRITNFCIEEQGSIYYHSFHSTLLTIWSTSTLVSTGWNTQENKLPSLCMHVCIAVWLPYSSKFPWSNIFVNFVNFTMITKIFATKFSWQQLIVQDLTLKNHGKRVHHENQARSRKFKTTEIWSHTVFCYHNINSAMKIKSIILGPWCTKWCRKVLSSSVCHDNTWAMLAQSTTKLG